MRRAPWPVIIILPHIGVKQNRKHKNTGGYSRINASLYRSHLLPFRWGPGSLWRIYSDMRGLITFTHLDGLLPPASADPAAPAAPEDHPRGTQNDRRKFE